jgi:hypothetical protein
MGLSASHFANPQTRSMLFEGLLRDMGGMDQVRRDLALRQALETAFMAGAALVRSDPAFDPRGRASDGGPGFIEFDDLPHDAQDGFLQMTQIVGLVRPGACPDKEPIPLVLRPFYTSDGKRSWWVELPKDTTEERWSPWVILTCERFGLITEFPNSPGRSTLTHRAIVMMQTGRASLDVPTTAAWERNVKARELAVREVRQPALV